MNITELGKKHDIGTQLAGRIRGEIEQRFQQDKQNAQKWVLDRLLQHGELTEDAYKTLKTEYGFGDEVIHNIYSTKQTEFEAIYQKGFRELKDYLYTQGSLQSIYEYVQTEYGLGDPVLRQICQELDEQFQLDQAQSQQDIHQIIAAHGPLSSDAISDQLRQQNCLFGNAVVQVLIQKVVEARQAAYQVYRRAYAEVFRRGVLLLSEEDKQSLERKRQQDGMTLSDQEVKVITEEYESALSHYREQYRSILYRYDLSDRSCLELEDSERAELEQRRFALKLATEDVQFVEQQKIEQYRLDLRGYEQMLNEALQRQVTLDERDRKLLEDYRREHHLERQIVDRIEARLLQPTEAFEKDIQRLFRHQHGQVVANEGLTAQVLEAIEQRRLAYNVTAQNAEALQHKVLDEYQNDLATYRGAVAEALPTDLLLLLQVTRGQLDDLRRELDLSASVTAKIEAEFADAIALYREFCLGLLQDNPNVADEVLQEMHKTQQMLNLSDEIAIAIKVEVEQTLYQEEISQQHISVSQPEIQLEPNEFKKDRRKLESLALPKIAAANEKLLQFINNAREPGISIYRSNSALSKKHLAVVGMAGTLSIIAASWLYWHSNRPQANVIYSNHPSPSLSHPIHELAIEYAQMKLEQDSLTFNEVSSILEMLRDIPEEYRQKDKFISLAQIAKSKSLLIAASKIEELVGIDSTDETYREVINKAREKYSQGNLEAVQEAFNFLDAITLPTENSLYEEVNDLLYAWRTEQELYKEIKDLHDQALDSPDSLDSWKKVREKRQNVDGIGTDVWHVKAQDMLAEADRKYRSLLPPPEIRSGSNSSETGSSKDRPSGSSNSTRNSSSGSRPSGSSSSSSNDSNIGNNSGGTSSGPQGERVNPL